jgi:hypothetical protein
LLICRDRLGSKADSVPSGDTALGRSVSKGISSLLEAGVLRSSQCSTRNVGTKLAGAINGVVARMLDQMVPGTGEVGFGDDKLGR